MAQKLRIFCFLGLLCYVIAQEINPTSFRKQKFRHTAKNLTEDEVRRLATLSDVGHMNEVLDNICIVRNVGSPGHKRVKNYLYKSMEDLGWTAETDKFRSDTPISRNVKFENIVARLNPNAQRYLALACHFDSKYIKEYDFFGATDSAVPCSQMINLAKVMENYLEPLKEANVSLMFIFFDGEEAFVEWGPDDSIYGARHLAETFASRQRTIGFQDDLNDLDTLDMLILLDLIGASDPRFYSYFKNTDKWYGNLVEAESKLSNLKLFEGYSYGKTEQTYFQPYSFPAHIEDDHLPFLRRNVPIVHVIPTPFPNFWHKAGDNRSNINMSTIENINKILRVFVASYFGLNV